MRSLGVFAAAAVAACIAWSPTAQADTRLTVGATRSYSTVISWLTHGLTPDQWYAYNYRIGENWFPGTTAMPIDYPASVFPVVAGPYTVGASVAIGQRHLDQAIKTEAASGPVVVAGLSQGALVEDAEMAALVSDPHAPLPGEVTFVEFGNPVRGLLSTYLAYGTRIPLIDITVTRPADTQYNVDVVAGQYDGWADPPDRPWNLLADLNAVMGIRYAHISSALDYKQNAVEVSQSTGLNGGVTTTYVVPTAHLPLTEPLRQLGVPGPTVDTIDGILRPVIDAGYSRLTPNAGPYFAHGALVCASAHPGTSSSVAVTASAHRSDLSSGRADRHRRA